MDNIWNGMVEVSDSFREWILENSNNPLLWVGLFMLGLIIFFVTYNALQKEK